MASIAVKFAADTAQFNKGVGGVKSVIGGLGSSIGKLVSGPMAALGAAVASVGVVSKAIGSVKESFDFGGRINDLASRTGSTAGQIVILEEALRTAGLEGSDVATILQKLGKNAEEAFSKGKGTQFEALEQIGITAESFSAKTLAEKFRMVSEGIGKITDPAKKAQIAMALFGKEGMKMVTLFNDPQAFATAEKTVGSLAVQMDKNAAALDQVGDDFGTWNSKMQELKNTLTIALLPALDKLATFIKDLEFGNSEVFMAQIKAFGAELAEELTAIGLFAGTRLVQGILDGLAKLNESDSIFTQIMQALNPVMGLDKVVQTMNGGKGFIRGLADGANVDNVKMEDFRSTTENMYGSNALVKTARELKENLDKANKAQLDKNAAENAVKSDPVPKQTLAMELKNMFGLWKMGDKFRVSELKSKETISKADGVNTGDWLSSLARIGGASALTGGPTSTIITLQRTANSHLQEIATNTRNRNIGSTGAVFA